VAAAAPRSLRERIERIRSLPAKGFVAYLRDGPQVILGDGSRLAAKWAAAAAVLADGASRGASYVDVRLPDRPVAGGVDVPQPESEQPPAGVVPGPVPGGPTGAAGPASGTPGTAPGVPGAATVPGTATAPGQAAAPPAGAAPDGGPAPAGTVP
jgi:hypothetical protein